MVVRALPGSTQLPRLPHSPAGADRVGAPCACCHSCRDYQGNGRTGAVCGADEGGVPCVMRDGGKPAPPSASCILVDDQFAYIPTAYAEVFFRADAPATAAFTGPNLYPALAVILFSLVFTIAAFSIGITLKNKDDKTYQDKAGEIKEYFDNPTSKPEALLSAMLKGYKAYDALQYLDRLEGKWKAKDCQALLDDEAFKAFEATPTS